MRWLLPTGIILVAAGIIGLVVINYFAFIPSQPGNFTVPFRGSGTPFRSGSFTSNGEQIFFTGASIRDTITASGGPIWFQMHGGGCANCHGPDGRGGTVIMMGRFNAPNITYQKLKKEGFTDDLIKRAITQGQDERGGALNQNMPRWHMSDQDINDVISYLKTLSP